MPNHRYAPDEFCEKFQEVCRTILHEKCSREGELWWNPEESKIGATRFFTADNNWNSFSHTVVLGLTRLGVLAAFRVYRSPFAHRRGQRGMWYVYRIANELRLTAFAKKAPVTSLNGWQVFVATELVHADAHPPVSFEKAMEIVSEHVHRSPHPDMLIMSILRQIMRVG